MQSNYLRGGATITRSRVLLVILGLYLASLALLIAYARSGGLEALRPPTASEPAISILTSEPLLLKREVEFTAEAKPVSVNEDASLRWEWDFGDGSTSATTGVGDFRKVPHAYSAADEYEVRVTLIGGAGNILAQESRTVEVGTRPRWEYLPGDGHVHTSYSTDALPFTSVVKMVDAAKRKGLSWFVVTDHNDFRPLRTIMDRQEWARLLYDAYSFNSGSQACESKDPSVTVIPGLELTTGSGDLKNPHATTGHFLAYRITHLVPAYHGRGASRLRYSQDEVLKIVKKQHAFGYIAHPNRFPVVPTQRLNSEPWEDPEPEVRDFPETVIGLEVLHESHPPPKATLDLWDGLLRSGMKVFGIGNSDTHHSHSVRMGYPPIGEAKTYVITTGDNCAPAVLDALRRGRSVFSNGPLLKMTVEGHIPGDTIKTRRNTLGVNLSWEIRKDLKKPWSILLIDQDSNVDRPAITQDISARGPVGSVDLEYRVRKTQKLGRYLRAVLVVEHPYRTVANRNIHNMNGTWYQAYTNPVFIDSTRDDFQFRVTGAGSKTATKKVELVRGGEATEDFFLEETPFQANFSADWEEGDVDVELIRPDESGIAPVSPINLPADVGLVTGATDAEYRVQSPAAGTWVVRVTAREVSWSRQTVTLKRTILYPTPPEVRLAGVADGQVVSGDVALVASAGDEYEVDEATLYLDGIPLFPLPGAGEYPFVWRTREVADGAHELSLMAVDELGAIGETSVQVIVDN